MYFPVGLSVAPRTSLPVGNSLIRVRLNLLILAGRGQGYKDDGPDVRGQRFGTDTRLIREDSGMLVLTRKTNESVVIAGGIEVMVVQVRGNRVRLGFRAPADISIQRCERVAVPKVKPDGILPAADAPAGAIATRPDRSRTAARPR